MFLLVRYSGVIAAIVYLLCSFRNLLPPLCAKPLIRDLHSCARIPDAMGGDHDCAAWLVVVVLAVDPTDPTVLGVVLVAGPLEEAMQSDPSVVARGEVPEMLIRAVQSVKGPMVRWLSFNGSCKNFFLSALANLLLRTSSS
jgi:hypothetical protein